MTADEGRGPRVRFSAVVAEVAGGATTEAASRRLGISHDLATGMVEEAARLGLLAHYSSSCVGCAPTRAEACVTCPLTRGRRPD